MPPPPADPDAAAPDLTRLKQLLWLYIALWIGEGALRKWIVPGLAAPLLVVRDPLLLFMYYLAFTKGLFPKGFLASGVIVLGATALMVSIAATSTPMVIQLYGLRASYLHLLLIFLIPNVFTLEDVRLVGKWTLIVAGPMALLVLAQFLAGPRSFLNAGAGGNVGAMIESAFGHIRPSGTFSFTNGLGGFTAMTAVFFLYHLLEKQVYPRLIWLASAPALVVLIVLSGSRSAAGLVALIMSALLFISIVHRRYRAAAIKLGSLMGVAFLGVGSFAVIAQGLAVFAYRFGDAANVPHGFIGRFFESFQVPFKVADLAPTFGYGLGMGTNVAGGVLLGHSAFLLAEGEMARNIMESGVVIGSLYLGLRACMVIYLGKRALVSLIRDVNTLPLLLFTGCFIDLLQGQFSQPTELGYATIACGLCLAANRRAAPASDLAAAAPAVAAVPVGRSGPPVRGAGGGGQLAYPVQTVAKSAKPTTPPVAPAAPVVPAIPKSAPVRGRSLYAEQLHAGPKNDAHDHAEKAPENAEKPQI